MFRRRSSVFELCYRFLLRDGDVVEDHIGVGQFTNHQPLHKFETALAFSKFLIVNVVD